MHDKTSEGTYHSHMVTAREAIKAGEFATACTHLVEAMNKAPSTPDRQEALRLWTLADGYLHS